MRVTRWKVMAGGLLLGAGGLMAVADGPAPAPGCQPLPLPLPPVVTTAAQVSPEPPITVPPPKVAELPPVAPALPPLPKVEPAPPPDPKAGYKLDNATAVLVEPKTGRTVTRRVVLTPDGKSYEVDDKGRPVRPDNPLLKPADTRPTDDPDPKPAVSPKPAFAAPVVPGDIKTDFGRPLPPPPSLAAQMAGGMSPPLPAPPAEVVPPPPQPVAAPTPAVPTEQPKKVSEPARPPEPSAAEKRLKVVLHMGDDRPRFEVRDGDEIYLKVVSDRVEVKSAADKGDAATMKAAGRVAFVTPGGDGTCDELAILPGSGQVVAAGSVAFRHTWGRSETTVTAERLTFRLNHAGPTAIQAGYTPVR